MLETKIDTRKTAVLVIDMQNNLIKAEEEPFNGVNKMVEANGAIGKTASVIAAARQRDLHVIVLSDCIATMIPEDDEYFIKQVFPREGRVRTSVEIKTAISGAGA